MSYNFDNIKLDFDNKDPISCFLCNLEFNLSNDIQPFLMHILDMHKILIENPKGILDLKIYIRYWMKLKDNNITDYCVSIKTNTEPNATEEQETFYLLSQKLPEDQQLRQYINDAKIKYVIEKKDEEYQNKDYSRKCLYCSIVVGGGISKVFHHLSEDHHFDLGNYGRLVFVDKMLNIIEEKFNQLICLYCEAQFNNHVAMREHMRKKHHKKINPDNRLYDQFYLINYVKPDMTWKEAKQELFEENDAQVGMSEDVVDFTDWTDRNEFKATCFFCNITQNPEELFEHMKNIHFFNFLEMTQNLSFYDKVKLTNYIRSKISEFDCSFCDETFSNLENVLEHMKNFSHFKLKDRIWDRNINLIPFISDDSLLQFLEDDEISDVETCSTSSSSTKEQIILPEDIPLSFNNSLTISEDIKFKCLFCPHHRIGEDTRTSVETHMDNLHAFDFKLLTRLDKDNAKKMINYIRCKCENLECYVCNKSFNTLAGLEEHRMLLEHTGLPVEHYCDDRWNASTMNNDGLLFFL